jgi:hypothetical protein
MKTVNQILELEDYTVNIAKTSNKAVENDKI